MEFNECTYGRGDGCQKSLSAPLMRVIGYTTSCIFSKDTMRILLKERERERKAGEFFSRRLRLVIHTRSHKASDKETHFAPPSQTNLDLRRHHYGSRAYATATLSSGGPPTVERLAHKHHGERGGGEGLHFLQLIYQEVCQVALWLPWRRRRGHS